MVTRAEDNPFPSILVVEQDKDALTESSPAAGQQRLVVDSTDHTLYLVDSTDTATSVGGTGGLTDPMTTRGDIIIRDASNVTARLGRGSASTVLTSDGTDISWQAAGSGNVATDTIWDAAGDLAVGTGANTASKLSLGGSEHVLGSDGSAASWMHMPNEIAAAQLVGATPAGASGTISDHFEGNSLSGSWTSEATALTSNQVKYSTWGVVAGANANHRVQSFTPSGAFRVECRLWCQSTTNLGSMGLLARDSSSGDSTGNGVAAVYTQNTASPATLRLLTLDTGTYTTRQTVSLMNSTTSTPLMPWVYIALERDGSNNWTAAVSHDRNQWITSTSTSKTVTIAKLGFRFGAATGGIDFIDVVS